MYSAVSVDGQRLYELARQGKTVERAARPVTILDLRLTAAEEEKNTYTIDVTCTKGAYIRTLIHDLGQALGCGAVMTALQRTCAMGVALADCVTLEQLQALRDSGGDFAPCLRPVDELLAAYPALQVTAAGTAVWQRWRVGCGAIASAADGSPITGYMTRRVCSWDWAVRRQTAASCWWIA